MLIVFGAKEEQLKVNAHLKSEMLKDHKQSHSSWYNYGPTLKQITKLAAMNLRMCQTLKDPCLSKTQENMFMLLSLEGLTTVI